MLPSLVLSVGEQKLMYLNMMYLSYEIQINEICVKGFQVNSITLFY